MLRLCATHVATLRNLCCDFARPKLTMLRLYANHVATLYDSWFDRVRLMIQPCSTHGSTLFDPWFDPVWPMIRPWSLFIWPCSTHDSSCSTHDSTLFDPWSDPVRLMVPPCSTLFENSARSAVLIGDENRTPFDRVGRIMSRKSQPVRLLPKIRFVSFFFIYALVRI